jgi:hypothetical protein
MDAPRRLTDPEADRKLRDLFAQAGPLQAPEDMEARVLRQLAAQPVSRIVEDAPLIGRNAWLTVGALFVGLLISTFLAPAARSTGSDMVQRYLQNLRLPDPGALLTSPWALMALACAAIFLGMEAFLFRPQAVRTRR